MTTRDQYPFPRPSAPVQLYLLGGLAAFGLAALWLAALHAFLQVASGPQAFFAATLIEAGLIIEALALIKRPNVWYTWLAVATSLTVSGTYNYIQVSLAVTGPNGMATLNPWQLGTLALGPLSALVFVSLTLGHELREHQNQVEKWYIDRGDWIEKQRADQEVYQRKLDEQRLADLHRMQNAERERQEREAERRFQAEETQREWERQQVIKRERRERRVERSDPFAVKAERSGPPSADAERPAASSANVHERSGEFDELLRIVRERSGGQAYRPEDVQAWAGLGRTKTFELLKYGQTVGDVHQVSRGQYLHNGKDRA